MPRSRPISLSILPDAAVETSNCATLVLNAYTIALIARRNERKAVDAAIRAWRERNPTALQVDAACAVENILGKTL